MNTLLPPLIINPEPRPKLLVLLEEQKMNHVKCVWFNEIITDNKQLEFLINFARMALAHLKKEPKKRFRVVIEEVEMIEEEH